MAIIRRLVVLVLSILAAALLVSCVPIPPYDPALAGQGVDAQQEGAVVPAATATAAAPLAVAELTSTPASLAQVEPTSAPATLVPVEPTGTPADTHTCPTDCYAGDACPGRCDEHARDCDDHAGQAIGCPGSGGADACRCAPWPTPTSMPTAISTARPAPTFTPRPTRTAAATPTRAPTMTRAATSTRAATPTATVDRHLIIITEADIAEAVAGGAGAQQGVTLDNLKVRFAGGKTRITADKLGYGIIKMQNLDLVGSLAAQNGVLSLAVESISPRGSPPISSRPRSTRRWRTTLRSGTWKKCARLTGGWSCGSGRGTTYRSISRQQRPGERLCHQRLSNPGSSRTSGTRYSSASCQSCRSST